MGKLNFDASVNNEFKDRLKDTLRELAKTDMGAKLLAALTNQDLSSLQISAAQNTNSLYGDVLYLDAINDSGIYPTSYRETILAHELFHVYQQNSMSGYLPKEAYIEVEARLFEYEVLLGFIEHSTEEGLDLELVWLERNFEPGYREDFYNYVEGGDRSLSGFNDLVGGFKAGVTDTTAYKDYQETPLEELPSLLATLSNTSAEDIGCK